MNGLSWDTKKDIIQAYLLVKWSHEGLSLLAEVKHNLLAYWPQQNVILDKQMCNLEHDPTPYSIGSIALLKKKRHEVDYYHSYAVTLLDAINASSTIEVSSQNDVYSDGDSLSEYEEDEDLLPTE